MVHRRAARRREKRRDQRPGDTHIHHTIFPQIRFANHHVGKYSPTDGCRPTRTCCPHFVRVFSSVHMRKPLPTTEQNEHVYRTESGKPFRKTGHVVVFEVRPEETQLRKYTSSFISMGGGGGCITTAITF